MPGPMSGRTDRAIVLEVLTLAGVPEPRGQVGAFQAVMAAHAPELAGLLRERGVALPGAAAALAALAGDAGGTGRAGDAAGTGGAGGARERRGAGRAGGAGGAAGAVGPRRRPGARGD